MAGSNPAGGGSSQVRWVGGKCLEIKLREAGAFTGILTRSYHKLPPLHAIRNRAPNIAVSFSSGNDVAEATAAARATDMAMVFAGEWRTEMLDQETLNLSADQENLIAAVAAANPRTIVMLQTGGPLPENRVTVRSGRDYVQLNSCSILRRFCVPRTVTFILDLI